MKTFSTFVMMPFGSNDEYGGGSVESDFIYKEIIESGVKDAIKQLNIDFKDDWINFDISSLITREVDKNQSGSITKSIVQSIAKADVVIVDITGKNPNVFLELGIRYALRNKVTILMAQVGSQIPFDIKVYRCIEYHHFKPSEARKQIAEAIQQGLSDDTLSDSIVFDVLPKMLVSIPGVAESYGSKSLIRRDTMTWEEYLRRIEETCTYLDAAVQNYRFLPDAVIGITNGGLIAADLIGKRVFSGRDIPVLSLWAQRHEGGGEKAFWYFSNDFNDATMVGIKSAKEKQVKVNDITLLVIDDHMGTGSTAIQVVTYLKDRLGERTQIIYIPIVSRRLDNISVVEDYLPYKYRDKEGRPVFGITKEQFISQLNTDVYYFPYLKKQVNVSTSG